MSLVVEGMSSNSICSHFFWQSEADPHCDFKSSIFLKATGKDGSTVRYVQILDIWRIQKFTALY